MLSLPVIISNFKAYNTSIGRNALELAKIHDKVKEATEASLVVAVQPSDIHWISMHVSIPVFAQHIDAVPFGPYTGHILPEAVWEAGAVGTLINHSEKRAFNFERIALKVKRAKEAGLITVVCAENLEEAKKIADLSPDFVAVEPPQLIGGNISVSKADPKIIEDAVKAIGKNKVIVGAGVKNGEDVRIAIELGACGVLLASGVAKAVDPEAVLRDLVGGMK